MTPPRVPTMCAYLRRCLFGLPPAGGASQPEEEPNVTVGRERMFVSVALLVVSMLALVVCDAGKAAGVLSPADGATVTTPTPTFTISLNATLQSDGKPSEYSPLIAIKGPSYGGVATVAFCQGVDQGNGTWTCSDPTHPLPNGVYLLTYTYTDHTCAPTVAGSYIPPSCFFTEMPGSGTSFTVNTRVAAAPGVPTAAVDRTSPSVKAVASYGIRGTTGKLEFRVSDNSGAARIVIVIGKGAHVLGHISTGLKQANGTLVYLPWHVPKAAPQGRQTFCVAAADQAGNTSRTSCATFTVE